MWEPEVSLGYYSREVIFLGLRQSLSLLRQQAVSTLPVLLLQAHVLGLGVVGTRSQTPILMLSQQSLIQWRYFPGP